MEDRHRSFRWRRVTLVVVVCTLFQTTLLGEVRVAGVRPDLLLPLVIAFAIRTGWPSACVLGWAIGLTKDLFSGTPFGIYSFMYLLAGFSSAYVAGRTFVEHPLTQAILAFIVALAVNAVCVFLLRPRVGLLPAYIVNGVVASLLVPTAVIVLYPLMRVLRGWLGGRHELVF